MRGASAARMPHHAVPRRAAPRRAAKLPLNSSLTQLNLLRRRPYLTTSHLTEQRYQEPMAKSSLSLTNRLTFTYLSSYLSDILLDTPAVVAHTV